jgi:hypothetical protein
MTVLAKTGESNRSMVKELLLRTYAYDALFHSFKLESIIYSITNKKGELPRLKCFHNGIILIVNCFKLKGEDTAIS